MTMKKRIAFALIAMMLSVGIVFVAILAADLYLHRRAERYAGVNAWGYRGARIGGKLAGERRIVVLGGSTAFGFGVTTANAFPAQLESQLRPLSRDGAPITVINLGMNSQGAYAFRFDLEDYAYLDYDGVILYEGYNDLGTNRNLLLARRESPVFRLTGYYPIFPVFFREKAMSLQHGGDISAGYSDRKTVFKPGLANQATAAALKAAADIGESLEQQLARLDRSPALNRDGTRVTVAAHGCPPRWADYCTAQYDAIQYVLGHGKKVLVVTQPYIDERHEEQQAHLRAMLASELAGTSGGRYADLGALIDMHGRDKVLFYDAMHANDSGNRLIASYLVRPVAELMSDVFNVPAANGSRPGSGQ